MALGSKFSLRVIPCRYIRNWHFLLDPSPEEYNVDLLAQKDWDRVTSLQRLRYIVM